MTDQDFEEALCVFAEGALQHRAKRLNHRYASLNYTLDVDPAHARNAVAPGFVRTDLTRGWPRRRRLAGDGGTLCCKSNDGPHRRTGGHRQCHSLLGLSRVRLDQGTDADCRRRTNGLHWTRLGRAANLARILRIKEDAYSPVFGVPVHAV